MDGTGQQNELTAQVRRLRERLDVERQRLGVSGIRPDAERSKALDLFEQRHRGIEQELAAIDSSGTPVDPDRRRATERLASELDREVDDWIGRTDGDFDTIKDHRV